VYSEHLTQAQFLRAIFHVSEWVRERGQGLGSRWECRCCIHAHECESLQTFAESSAIIVDTAVRPFFWRLFIQTGRSFLEMSILGEQVEASFTNRKDWSTDLRSSAYEHPLLAKSVEASNSGSLSSFAQSSLPVLQVRVCVRRAGACLCCVRAFLPVPHSCFANVDIAGRERAPLNSATWSARAQFKSGLSAGKHGD
jgi:hypothetical protein